MKISSLWLAALVAMAACTPDSDPEQQPIAPEPSQAPPEPQAQPAEPPAAAVPQVRVRGTVVAFEEPVMTVQTEADGPVAVTVGPQVGINGLAARSLSDIGNNTFIGTTAVRDREGRWQATEVHIFPEAMRGAGEGHYPWDLPESTMTNAAVSGVVTAENGRTLNLRYPAGEVAVHVAEDVPIVELVPGDRSLLVPGAAVFVLGAPDGDAVNAFAILAEKDGVKPPM